MMCAAQVVDSVLEAFEGPPFDYGMTISDRWVRGVSVAAAYDI